MEQNHLITSADYLPPAYRIFDGTYATNNCSGQVKIQWSYNYGMLLNAAAVMWNVTQDPIWEERANGVWQAAIVSLYLATRSLEQSPLTNSPTL